MLTLASTTLESTDVNVTLLQGHSVVPVGLLLGWVGRRSPALGPVPNSTPSFFSFLLFLSAFSFPVTDLDGGRDAALCVVVLRVRRVRVSPTPSLPLSPLSFLLSLGIRRSPSQSQSSSCTRVHN